MRRDVAKWIRARDRRVAPAIFTSVRLRVTFQYTTCSIDLSTTISFLLMSMLNKRQLSLAPMFKLLSDIDASVKETPMPFSKSFNHQWQQTLECGF
jgi:hypothetical protein